MCEAHLILLFTRFGDLDAIHPWWGNGIPIHMFDELAGLFFASPLSCMLIFYPLCLKTKLHNFVETFFKRMLTRTAREAVALKVSSKQQTIIMPNVQERLIKHCFEIPNVHGKRYVRAAREAVAPRVSSRQTQSQ